MAQKLEIKRCEKAYKFKRRIFGVSFLLLAIVCIPLLLIPFKLWSNNFYIWSLIILCLALLFYFVSSFIFTNRWHKTHYYIVEDALLITTGSMMGNQDKMYPFDGITRATINQGFLEKRNQYGNIVLTVKDRANKLILNDVEDPQNMVETLLKNMHESIVTKIVN